ncbi:NAD-dependent epimerase/dehydratase family protein [Inquilinus sp. CAU 1745]|uniref:NAD-dependent epimerase/dehydratase family protein n=1 Tax=Inquilinus sp. CAU 1745 TaxID=3140369 RepID=UPI00325BB2E7
MKPPLRKHPDLGVVEWFRPGEHDRVTRCLDHLSDLGVGRLRTHVSWADYHTPEGRGWYDWLLPRLGEAVDLLPCLHYTPPSLSETGRSSGPPRNLRDFADFLDEVTDRYGEHFDTVELWNEPNNLLDWDWRVDPDWLKFCEMIGAAAHWAQEKGFAVVLGGPCPNDTNWLNLMGERGVLGVVDVLGVHGFPGTWDSEHATWPGWSRTLQELKQTARAHNPGLDFWITESGYSTWRNDPFEQVGNFLDLLRTEVGRTYWYALEDLPADMAVQEGVHFDKRHYHFGLYTATGQPKLLARLLSEGGVENVEKVARHPVPKPALVGRTPVLVTGGAGFIGANLADRLARDGKDVLVYDSLARPGVDANLDWLKQRHPAKISVAIADIRDDGALADAAADAEAVFHFAAQVAVTSSLLDPVEDFEVNLQGTLRLLETLRRRGTPPPLVFASTNKVYGDLGDIVLEETGGAYRPADPDLRAHGIGENWPLDFHTPYGCSKGAADQYVLDYVRSFGIPAAVLRMSCIYGPRQRGTEDQGWVAHFARQALTQSPISIFGDGHQVRDVLHVDDAVAAYLAAWRRMSAIRGRAFNLGGGPDNAVSLLQIIGEIERICGYDLDLEFLPWRAGDQRYFVADIRRAMGSLGLGRPKGWREGLPDLIRWMSCESATVLPSPRNAADTDMEIAR